MKFHLAIVGTLALGLSASTYAHFEEIDLGEQDFFVNQSPKERKALQNMEISERELTSFKSSARVIQQDDGDELDEEWVTMVPSSKDFDEDFTYQSSWLPEFIRPIGGHLAWDALDQFVSVVAPAWAYSPFSLWRAYPSAKAEASSWNPFTWRPTSQVGKYAEFGVKVLETCVIGSHPYLLGVGKVMSRFL